MKVKVESYTAISEKLRRIWFMIKVLRQERHIQKTELAQAVGITQTHLSNSENGQSVVTL